MTNNIANTIPALAHNWPEATVWIVALIVGGWIITTAFKHL